jgi:ABC-type taurine transport system substrate-binding protein
VYPSRDVVHQSKDRISADPRQVNLTDDEWRKLTEAYQRGDITKADQVWTDAISRENQGSPPAKAFARVNHVWFGQ